MAKINAPSEYKPAPREDLSVKAQLCIALCQAANKTARLYRVLLEPFDLTFSQYQVLIALWDRGTSTVGQLCSDLDLETNTITPVVKRLEALGYVERHRDRIDERRVFVALTSKGEAFRTEGVAIRCRLLDATNASLSDVEDLKRKLQQFCGMVDRAMAVVKA